MIILLALFFARKQLLHFDIYFLETCLSFIFWLKLKLDLKFPPI